MKVYERTPLNLDRMVVPRGRVFLIPGRCKGCNICIQFCPRDVLQESKGQNAKGPHQSAASPLAPSAIQSITCLSKLATSDAIASTGRTKSQR